MDVFYEESSVLRNSAKAEKKYKIVHIISMIFLTIGIMGVLFALMIPFQYLIFWGIICLQFFLIWFILSKWKATFNVSYDYAFVSGELRIAKVININKRKLVARLNPEDIIQIGDVDNPGYERFAADPSTKKVICTSNVEAAENKFFMYILANYNGKKLYVLECREDLLMHMLKFVKRTTLESDYVMQEKKKAMQK
ncbi:MAG: hypothetical protein IJ393_00515 [Clostridia bacterium]|nr:hypothetical protein [Clostridia bacterium]